VISATFIDLGHLQSSLKLFFLAASKVVVHIRRDRCLEIFKNEF
jgi:hypothetical protein